jgi:hypothetical protein
MGESGTGDEMDGRSLESGSGSSLEELATAGDVFFEDFVKKLEINCGDFMMVVTIAFFFFLVLGFGAVLAGLLTLSLWAVLATCWSQLYSPAEPICTSSWQASHQRFEDTLKPDFSWQ